MDPLQGELENILLVNMERQRSLAKRLDKVAGGEHPWAGALEMEAALRESSKEPAVAASSAAAAAAQLRLPTHISVNGDRESKSQALNKVSPTFALLLPSHIGQLQMQMAEAALESPGGHSYQPVPITDRRGRKRVYFWPQNHMPDKFWQFVATYADAPGDEDIKTVKVSSFWCDPMGLEALQRRL